MDPKLKKIIIISSVIILILVIWAVVDIVSKIGKLEVVLATSPSDSQITIDGNNIKSGKSYIKKGSHIFTAKRSGFDDYSTTVNITDDFKDSIILLLEPNSDEGYAFLKDNPKEQSIREGWGGLLANQDNNNRTDKTPLIKLLPFIDREYRVDYGSSSKTPNDNIAVSIIITFTTEASKQDALKWIENNGYNINDLEIIYKDFNSK